MVLKETRFQLSHIQKCITICSIKMEQEKKREEKRINYTTVHSLFLGTKTRVSDNILRDEMSGRQCKLENPVFYRTHSHESKIFRFTNESLRICTTCYEKYFKFLREKKTQKICDIFNFECEHQTFVKMIMIVDSH